MPVLQGLSLPVSVADGPAIDAEQANGAETLAGTSVGFWHANRDEQRPPHIQNQMGYLGRHIENRGNARWHFVFNHSAPKDPGFIGPKLLKGDLTTNVPNRHEQARFALGFCEGECEQRFAFCFRSVSACRDHLRRDRRRRQKRGVLGKQNGNCVGRLRRREGFLLIGAWNWWDRLIGCWQSDAPLEKIQASV